MSRITEAYKLFQGGAMWQALSHTREKEVRAWSDFWKLLICSGFEFAKDDLTELRDWCDQNHWKRTWYPPGEGHYNLAVYDRNITFARAYEVYVGRTAFIYHDVEYGHYRGGYVVHGGGDRKRGRLVIGAKFIWAGEPVEVTSFKDETQSLVACAYHPKIDRYEPKKIRKRFTISIDDLKKAWRLER